MQIYLSRLNPDGVLAIHISNNHLDLRPVVAGMMRDLGLAGRVQFQDTTDMTGGKFGSHWTVVARSEAALGVLATDDRWKRFRPTDKRTWTDDFSNIWTVLFWR